ncbi:peptidylprolyl isomerase SurA [Parendozoicomonas haliclonae]|uniref:Chaperone SurA n=1 Tax=Parendozoicomonas haliclonae TaxID=1960125 RepID=A0A1X7AER2_9GAMM|nr:peptidylprolyl isomerase SurA [Parendozoicomonas haliclonae]SMA35404.1 Chaperone SurA precursor [Parendozoicomonas haliclonae]
MKNLRHILLAAAASIAFTGAMVAPVTAKVVPLDRVVAIVDNDVIMESELNNRLKSVRMQIQERSTALPPEHVLKQQVLERLIIENLQLQIADRAGARIDDNSLNDAIRSIAQRNGMTLDQFRQALEQDGLSYVDAREQIRREMLINRVRQRQVMERIQVTDREVDNFRSSAEGQQRMAVEYRLGHILVSLPEGATPDQIAQANKKAEGLYDQLNKGADFSQVAVSQSQGQNALEGGDLGWRKADQLPSLFANVVTGLKEGEVSRPIRSPSGFHLITLNDTRGNEQLLQEQVKARHILIKPNEVRSDLEAQELARSIYDRIESGAEFSELAKAYSDDPGSALNGGDLGWANPDDMVPAFREKMLTTNMNTPTAPFRSQFGWHILEVQGKRKEDISDKVQAAQIRDIIGQRKFEEELQVWLRELRDQAYVEIKL